MRHRLNCIRHARWLLATGLVVAGAAAAQHAPVLDRASLWIGGYAAHSDTTVRAGMPDGGYDGDLNLEHDLGFRRRTWTPRLRAEFLVGDSQGFTFDYYRYRRKRSDVLSDTISYSGETYDAHARIHARLGFDFGSAAYRWWIGKGNDVFGIGLGAGYYRLQASFRGQATVNGITGQAASSTDESAWAPLLQLGWRHAFNDRWRMYLHAAGVGKNGGRLYGKVYHTALGMQWFPARHLGISAEYDLNRIRLHQRHHDYSDSLDLQLAGPSVFATFRF